MASERTYLFDHAWKHEAERLAAIEWSLDGYTISCLSTIGVEAGWRCLEVGAGAGSIASWLSDKVGETGRVIATDLDIGMLEKLRRANLEVRRHDITCDALDEQFDLVHARKVLEHLPEPERLVKRMGVAVKRNGWLLIEDADLLSLRHVTTPDPALFRRGYDAFVGHMASHGYHADLGLHLADLLRAAGFEGVKTRGWIGEWTGHGPNPSVFLRTFEKIRDHVVDEGRLDATTADAFLRLIQEPTFKAITAVHFAAWGRRPSASAV
jgi:SAM-dependent methyltransferase